MNIYTEYILLAAGFVVLILLSVIIERKVSKQLSPKIGSCTYIVVTIICIYYAVDVSLSSSNLLTDIYFYFWTILVFVELLLYRFKRIDKSTDK